jgi:hypothetical protein
LQWQYASKQADVIGAALAFTAAGKPESEIFRRISHEWSTWGHHAQFNSRAPIRFAPRFTDRPDGFDVRALAAATSTKAAVETRALKLLSDGGDNASHLSLINARNCQRSSATIYAIGFYDGDWILVQGFAQKIRSCPGDARTFRALSDLNRVWRDVAGESATSTRLASAP